MNSRIDSRIPLVARLSWRRALSSNAVRFFGGKTNGSVFAAAGANSNGSGGFLGAGITYRIPLAHAIPNKHIIDVGTRTDASLCPGVGHAARGYLCLYDTKLFFGVSDGYGYSSNAGLFSKPSPGVVLYWKVTGTHPYVGGEYTVTAP